MKIIGRLYCFELSLLGFFYQSMNREDFFVFSNGFYYVVSFWCPMRFNQKQMYTLLGALINWMSGEKYFERHLAHRRSATPVTKTTTEMGREKFVFKWDVSFPLLCSSCRRSCFNKLFIFLKSCRCSNMRLPESCLSKLDEKMAYLAHIEYNESYNTRISR